MQNNSDTTPLSLWIPRNVELSYQEDPSDLDDFDIIGRKLAEHYKSKKWDSFYEDLIGLWTPSEAERRTWSWFPAEVVNDWDEFPLDEDNASHDSHFTLPEDKEVKADPELLIRYLKDVLTMLRGEMVAEATNTLPEFGWDASVEGVPLEAEVFSLRGDFMKTETITLSADVLFGELRHLLRPYIQLRKNEILRVTIEGKHQPYGDTLRTIYERCSTNGSRLRLRVQVIKQQMKETIVYVLRDSPPEDSYFTDIEKLVLFPTLS